MRKSTALGLGLWLGAAALGCTGARSAPALPPASNASAASSAGSTSHPLAADGAEPADRGEVAAGATTWVGASAESEVLISGTRETFLGVWVDVPEPRGDARSRAESRPPIDVALAVDTSGSMGGAKIENARRAATMLVESLRDGDIVALDAFSDTARPIVPPTRLTPESRREILRAIAALRPSGSTNMFDGLTLAERQVGSAPASHTVRRVVVISDGMANVGPSSPEVLGDVAERGLRWRAQVTALGVGTDYDERTLNALAVRSSGRLYHLTEPREMASIMKGELDLWNATLASDSFLEVVPAAGVQVLGAEGVRSERGENGALRIPLGALHAGQHREVLVGVGLADPAAFEAAPRALASVRLRFRDVHDDDLERVQEVVARARFSSDAAEVAAHASSRTKAIMAIQESARIQMAAAQRINDGDFVNADRELAKAESALVAQAATVTSATDKKRIDEARSRVAAARATTRAMPAMPKPAQRASALEMNASGMKDMGF